MIEEEEHLYENMSYEDMLHEVCDRDPIRYTVALLKCMQILTKIPEGWDGS